MAYFIDLGPRRSRDNRAQEDRLSKKGEIFASPSEKKGIKKDESDTFSCRKEKK